MLRIKVVKTRRPHLCASFGCGEWIPQGEYAILVEGRGVSERHHIQCWERETGESVDLPNYQLRLFGDKPWCCGDCGTKNPPEAIRCIGCGRNRLKCCEE